MEAKFYSPDAISRPFLAAGNIGDSAIRCLAIRRARKHLPCQTAWDVLNGRSQSVDDTLLSVFALRALPLPAFLLEFDLYPVAGSVHASHISFIILSTLAYFCRRPSLILVLSCIHFLAFAQDFALHVFL